MNKDFSTRVAAIITSYGEGVKAGMPDRDIWTRLESASGQPVTLVNFFKLRAEAVYSPDFPGGDANVDGQTAFNRYAAVSMPTLVKVGGQFLAAAPFGGTFVGESEDWDIVAIGTYPDAEALLSLYETPEYQQAYAHRNAACITQRVSLLMG